MADGPKEKPFYERPWFAGTVALVGLIGAVWVLTVKVFDTAGDIAASNQEIVYSNTQIILDTSEGMGEPFGDGTKLDAAVEAIEKYVVPLEREGLALRRTGVACDEGSKQLVDFGTGHADDVVDEAKEQHAEGRSTLAYAVIETINDLIALDDPREPPSARQIVIITGGVGDEECFGSGAGAEIRGRLEGSGIDATFKLVALSPEPSANERLQSFEDALGGAAEFAVVETPEELAEVVEEDTAEMSVEIEELADLAAESSELDELGSGEGGEGETGGGEEAGADEGEEGNGTGEEAGSPGTGSLGGAEDEPGSPGTPDAAVGAPGE